MPAVGRITLDAKQYEQMLAQVEKKTAAATGNMSQGMDSVGRNVGKAGNVLSAFSAAGARLGKLGKVVSALAGGPVVALTAALGALVAVGVSVWDKMTLSAEEYQKRLERISADADYYRQQTEKAQSSDNSYMSRLQELSNKEQLSNAAKKEAAGLLTLLESRYGALGMSIDKTTGRLIGFEAAQRKVIEAQKRERQTAIRTQLESSSPVLARALNAAAASEASVGNRGYAIRRTQQDLRGKSLADAEVYARAMRDASKTDAGAEAWQRVVDLIRRRIELQKELKTLQTADPETAKKETAIEQKGMDAYASLYKSLREQLAVQRRLIRGELERAREIKIINDLKSRGVKIDKDSVGAAVAMQRRIGANQLNLSQQDELMSISDKGLRQAGYDKLADQGAALRRAKELKGADLTKAERERTLKMVDLSRTLALGGPQFRDIQTNSLTARGGFAGGVRNQSSTNYAKISADNAKKIVELQRETKSLLDKLVNGEG